MKRLQAYPIYLTYSFASALMRYMHFTLLTVYYVRDVGMTPFQLMLVGTTVMIVILGSEIPTGIIADVYGRRLSIILGTTLIGLGFILEGLVPLFWVVICTQLIWGVGVTFTSGALEAWIYDELQGVNIDMVYLRGTQVGNIGSLVGLIMSVALAHMQLNLPVIVSGLGLVVLALFLLLAMPEHHFPPTIHPHQTSWHATQYVLHNSLQMIRIQPILLTIMGITFFFGMASETYDRLWEVHFLDHFVLPRLGQINTMAWFGMIRAGVLLLSIMATEIMRHRINTQRYIGMTPTLSVITTVLFASMVGFGLAGHVMTAIAFFWIASLMRYMINPLYTAWINRQINDSNVRATMLSFTSQVDAVGQITGGPPFGWLATVASTRAAMCAAATVLLFALALFRRAWKQETTTAQAEIVETPVG